MPHFASCLARVLVAATWMAACAAPAQYRVDTELYRAADAYRPNPRHEPIRLPPYLMREWEEQRSADTPRPPQPPRPPRPRTPEELERERKEAQELAARQKAKAEMLRKLQASRQQSVVVMRQRADQIMAKGSVTPAEFEELVTLSVPDWGWMSHWADRAVQLFPREFAFRRAVLHTFGCSEAPAIEAFVLDKICPLPAGQFGFVDEAARGFADLQKAAAQGSMLDKALYCGFEHMRLGELEAWVDANGNVQSAVEEADDDSRIGDRLKFYTAQLQRVRDAITRCEAALAPVSTDLREGLFKTMWRQGKSGIRKPYSVDLWYIASHQSWTAPDAFKDAAGLQAAVKRARERSTWLQAGFR